MERAEIVRRETWWVMQFRVNPFSLPKAIVLDKGAPNFR
jgi:hypothetical protein